jgi:glycosyltransferase involved in cell wall biosynthesis
VAESIGVVIPTFNRPKQTIRAVESALNQTIKASQIIVIDDGSSDENLRELEKMLSEVNVEFVKLNHTGSPGLVRNEGIKRLSTDLVAFLDSDDHWIPEKLELQLKQMSELKARAVCSNAIISLEVGFDTKYQDRPTGKITRSSLIKSNQIICSSVLLDRQILLKVSGFAEKSFVQGAEDYATWLRISTMTDWHYTNEPLVSYSKEAIPHYSHNGSLFPELQAYSDFIQWTENRDRHKNLKFRLIMKLLKLVMLTVR